MSNVVITPIKKADAQQAISKILGITYNTDEINARLTQAHEHDNKALLDDITSDSLFDDGEKQKLLLARYILTPETLTPEQRTEIESNDDLMNIFRNRRIDNAGRGGDLIINGGFDIWQRGTSQTINGYGSDDRWSNNHSTSTRTHSRQTFTAGQTDVPGNPTFFSRTVFAHVNGLNSFVVKLQRIEGVRLLEGRTVTFSFWARADANKRLGVTFYQHFGTGGSPARNWDSQVFELTTQWQKFETTTVFPTIEGTTSGAGTNSAVQFWFTAGNDTAIGQANVGMPQQSGTIDIAQVKLERGNTATPFVPRHIAEELALCKRYFDILSLAGVWFSSLAENSIWRHFDTEKQFRISSPRVTIPNHLSLTFIQANGVQSEAISSNLFTSFNASRFVIRLLPSRVITGMTNGNFVGRIGTEVLVHIDAEL